MAIVAAYVLILVIWAFASVAFNRWTQPLKPVSVIRVIVTVLVTFGYFYPIWFLRRRAGLNRLDSPRKLSAWPFLVALAFMAIRDVMTVAYSIERPPDWLGLVELPLVLLLVVQAFFVRDILENACIDATEDPALQHFQQQSNSVSGLLTLFFGIFYLQHVINKRVGSLQEARVEHEPVMA
jgi:Na+/H+ antiporter NhaD/arsenite permease-like protein